MTKQEVFDRVVTFLRAQGQPSVSDNIGCAYRGEYGAMCAAGCLIQDEFYDECFEGSNVVCSHVALALLNSGVPTDLHPFVGRLQDIHDGPVDAWEERWATLAQQNELTMPGVVQ